ncbi:hypothetical protein GCM10025864_41170 [Luteimicrobium album]|uniref:Sporulation protein n=2 Tax=Luteimicrobium album TaxID=1054550 RepID=A0ABQ6I874_9MICO|nr:hypothetical protein GCM10025864_41170 [Luteimicrobium album]
MGAMSDDAREWTPDLGRLTQAADDAFTVGRVFGQAYEHQGTLVIPVARVLGAAGTGAGGGAGNGSGAGSGSGSGNGTGRGSGGGTGRGSGRGSFSFLRQGSVSGSQRLGAAEATGEEGKDLVAPASDDAPSGNGNGANGDAQAEAKGDLQGEAHGEATGDARGEAGAGGGAYGVRVKPVGVVVVENGATRWIPVFDLNRTIVGGQAFAAVAAVALAWAIGRRRR